VADTLKEIHQALNEGQPEYYAIPQDRLLVAQEFLLFENAGSDDLEDFVDSQFSKAGFLLRIPWVDGVHLASFVDEVEQHFQQVLGESVEVTMTGGGVIAARTFSAVVRSMARSYALAFLIVTPLMILVLASLRAGLISMIPNLMPILLTLGLMGWLDLPLDFSTMMIGAIILGVAVDDTIHFMHGFRGYLGASADPEQAVRRTLETTGRALLFTSIVLFAGMLIYVFATMGNLVNFGLLSAFAVASAFLADVVLAPALLVLIPSAHTVTPRQPSVVPNG
jgi:predicted RND superfamily exporter protein